MVALPPTCERALLERFLKAEAMALWSVRAAQTRPVPSRVRAFLARHERDEASHLQEFEAVLGRTAHARARPPRVPDQWEALAVHLFGYEALGLELARLLVSLRPDLGAIVRDEEAHVGFFERELRLLLAEEGSAAARTVQGSARAWWRRLPPTLDRYLSDEALSAYRVELRRTMLDNIRRRFDDLGLRVEAPRNAARQPGGPLDGMRGAADARRPTGSPARR